MSANLKRRGSDMMVFILSMTVYGIACIISELLPSIMIGIVEIKVKYFLFIPLSLAMLFEPMPVALGASTGKLVFGSMMIGKFKGLGSFKKFFTVAVAVYIAGLLVKDPKNKRQVAVAAAVGTAVQLILGVIIDITLVSLALDDYDTIAGLADSVVVVKCFEALNDFAVTGVLFCILPSVFLTPKLYGKIEPLMGMTPRGRDDYRRLAPKAIAWCGAGFVLAFLTNYLSVLELPTFLDAGIFRDTFFAVALTGVLVIAAVIMWVRGRWRNDKS